MKINAVILSLILFLSGCGLFNPDEQSPSPKTVDTSGFVIGTYPENKEPYIKGFLPDIGERKIAIVARHSNPNAKRPNNTIFCVKKNGEKVFRKIIYVEKPNLIFDEPERIQKGFGYGDISLILLDKPMPKDCAVYPIGEMRERKGSLFNRNKYGQWRKFDAGKAWWLVTSKYVIGGEPLKYPKLFVSGDSGTPWLKYQNQKWNVVAITSRGNSGYALHLGNPVIKKRILEQVKHMFVLEPEIIKIQ